MNTYVAATWVHQLLLVCSFLLLSEPFFRSTDGSTLIGSRLRVEAAVVTPAASSPLSSPVIGVFSQPRQFKDPFRPRMPDDDEYPFYIASSYGKWIEAGGARCIVVPYDASPSLLDDLFTQIHALFLPGGGAAMSPAIEYMIQKAVQSNAQGHYFPVWGTCLGFEFLVRYFGNDTHADTLLENDFDAQNISLSLENVVSQSLYKDTFMYRTVTTQNVTLNNHNRGIRPEAFQSIIGLHKHFVITSTNVDQRGKPFVSTMEPRHLDDFPFYGVQYHPEKNAFEYGTYPGTNIPFEVIDHSDDAVRFSLDMARSFVRLARQTMLLNGDRHAYTQPSRFPILTSYPVRPGLAFEQIYVVPPAAKWSQISRQRMLNGLTGTEEAPKGAGNIPARSFVRRRSVKDESVP